MAVYDYLCKSCKATFQVRKPMAEANTAESCPECQSQDTQRLISLVAIFSNSSDGQKRAVAAGPSCAGCGLAATGCSTCRPR